MPRSFAFKNLSPVAGMIDPKVPAKAYPEAFDKKNTPYNNEEKRFGDSFPTNDKPIGDKHNSAQVWIKYNKINHLMANKPLLPKSFTL